MMVRWSGERQVNVKSQSELDIGGRQTCMISFQETGLFCLQNNIIYSYTVKCLPHNFLKHLLQYIFILCAAAESSSISLLSALRC